jgi:N-acetylneuraminate synthase
VIAEAGVNHGGDLGVARELVAMAADAGADVVKFQTFVTARSITVSAPKADYQVATTGSTESQFEMVRRLELTRADHEVLIEDCRRLGIGFLSTAFDAESLALLLDLGIDRIKVASGELTNLPLLRRFAATGLPMLVSTGMADLDEVAAALAVIEGAGTPRERVTLLHCTTEYPAPDDEVNLRAMATLRDRFGTAVGYSDHTTGIAIAIAAVALGASVIEKHVTLDRDLPGPDQRASLEPADLAAMIAGIRSVEAALGDGIKRPTASELRNRSIARKSLVAARPIRAGEPFSPDNVDTKRPGTGLSPMLWDELIGRPASRDYAADELIER